MMDGYSFYLSSECIRQLLRQKAEWRIQGELYKGGAAIPGVLQPKSVSDWYWDQDRIEVEGSRDHGAVESQINHRVSWKGWLGQQHYPLVPQNAREGQEVSDPGWGTSISQRVNQQDGHNVVTGSLSQNGMFGTVYDIIPIPSNPMGEGRVTSLPIVPQGSWNTSSTAVWKPWVKGTTAEAITDSWRP